MATRGERLAARLRSQIGDERVLAAIAEVPRERFVPPELLRDAYRNGPLPIGAGQTISQPLVVAHMSELLELDGSERVLDVGGGSGYHAAVLSRLARWVWSIERLPELAGQERLNLAAAGVENVTVLVGDGRLGVPDQAPFDAINVAAAARHVPAALEEQLAVGGRLVAPVGSGRDQRLVVERRGPAGIERQLLSAVRFVPLVE
ncbi:MAG: protein-L-isoaspartate O-methyltransferase [Solirubrobacterales bacterium]|nr:protein-L-isoaspartate O-methyltransferase [Solirubrobacterales bacterium]